MDKENSDSDSTKSLDILRPGSFVLHFRIIRKIGSGGMGDVYLAEDGKLKRQVALKFLAKKYLTDSVAKIRFTREAQAAAALDHQNVVAIHEVNEYKGRPFFAMQYIEGKSLKDYISGARLKISEVIEIAIQVCSALRAASEKGIVHRDIKPSNILIGLTGRVTVVDFGLAKIRGEEKLTESGSTIGTYNYMSPEQAEGKELDERSDIFSFGVVLYEMITAKRPFKGADTASILHAITHDDPEPLARFKSGVPGHLQDVLDRALQKDPELRYQTAADLFSDLRRVEVRQYPAKTRKRISIITAFSIVFVATIGFSIYSKFFADIPRKSDFSKRIAVLPFRNIGSPDQEYFADGITDEITTKLAKISRLGVISSTSAIKYKNTTKSTKEIGNELDVDYVLQGTIRWDRSQTQNLVIISPQLVRVNDDMHVWAESYERVLDEIFSVQSRIAKSVASALHVTLFESEQRELESRPTTNLNAYDYYLRANVYLNRGSLKEDILASIELYQRAVSEDKDFSLAYAGLGLAHLKMYWFGRDQTNERRELANIAIEKAILLDPHLPEVHVALGYYNYWGGLDYEKALEEFSIAQKSQPNSSDIFEASAYVYRRRGEFDKALKNLEMALSLDPFSTYSSKLGGIAFELGNTQYRLRNWKEARRFLTLSIEISPDNFYSYSRMIRLFIYEKGNVDSARVILDKATSIITPAYLLEDRLWLEALDGNFEEALDMLQSPGEEPADYYLLKGFLYYLMDDEELKHLYYDSARIELEFIVKNEPNLPWFRRYLGIAYAGLGRNNDAIRECKTAIDLFPVSRDPFYHGPMNIEALAQVYAMVGDAEHAVQQLELLLALPAGLISIPYLKLAPEYTQIRQDSLFQNLLNSNF